MKITDFSELVTLMERGKQSLSIAQVKEVLRCANVQLDGELYKLIRKLDKETPEALK